MQVIEIIKEWLQHKPRMIPAVLRGWEEPGTSLGGWGRQWSQSWKWRAARRTWEVGGPAWTTVFGSVEITVTLKSHGWRCDMGGWGPDRHRLERMDIRTFLSWLWPTSWIRLNSYWGQRSAHRLDRNCQPRIREKTGESAFVNCFCLGIFFFLIQSTKGGAPMKLLSTESWKPYGLYRGVRANWKQICPCTGLWPSLNHWVVPAVRSEIKQRWSQNARKLAEVDENLLLKNIILYLKLLFI